MIPVFCSAKAAFCPIYFALDLPDDLFILRLGRKLYIFQNSSSSVVKTLPSI